MTFVNEAKSRFKELCFKLIIQERKKNKLTVPQKFKIMRLTTIFIIGLVLSTLSVIQAQNTENKWDFNKDHVVGSQVFVLFANFAFDPSPEYYELNYGYRFSKKDELSIELKTWTYQGPLGRPYGPDYESADSGFPGDVKAYGAGLAYKRLLWKGFYGQFHSTAFRQIYRDQNKETMQKGFQLFNTLRLGYHFKFLKSRWYLAPSIACTNWPINTNLPASFQTEEDKWPSYFLFEPGLQFGFVF